MYVLTFFFNENITIAIPYTKGQFRLFNVLKFVAISVSFYAKKSYTYYKILINYSEYLKQPNKK